MKEIKTFETTIRQNAKSLEELEMNATLFWAYRTNKGAGGEPIDFNEAIWNYDIVEITQVLRTNGITEFTISPTFSSLLEALVIFEKQGISTAGLITAKTRYTDWKTSEYAFTLVTQMTVKET